MRALIRSCLVAIATLVATISYGQGTVKGTVYDDASGETLIGASVVLKGTTIGKTTDIDGNFEVRIDESPPFVLLVKFMGYTQKEVTVDSFDKRLKISLGSDEVLISEVEIVGSRISEKTKQSALTVESMDLMAIKEAPSGNFYESLGNLKGVDITSASLGFKIINTRGFNSTSPVRSLQLIDGVDNQSPGLNFSLGNFLGASDLDIMTVDIIAGASSAYYGPGAFNGVIDMRTKDPYLFPGLTTSIKFGERSLFEGAVRWADAVENKKGEKRFGYKINLFYMTAYDWEADNLNPVDGSSVTRDNFSGYDAINRYADEVTVGGNNFERDLNTPGLGRVYRTGYEERDIADYNTNNAKANLGLYYKFKKDITAHYNFSYGNGTTIYQGDNRISLRNIQFYQNKIELQKENKWFVRFYSTHEDAGDSYDAVLTANIMANTAMGEGSFYRNYGSFYRQNNGQLYEAGMPSQSDFSSTQPQFSDFFNDGVFDQDGFQSAQVAWRTSIINAQNQWAAENSDFMQDYNDMIRRTTENSASQNENPYFRPGTARFDSLFNDVTSRLFTDNGSRFYDKSALYHGQAERTSETGYGKFIFGGSGRIYRPDSRGTIFEDTLTFTRERVETVDQETGEVTSEVVKTDSTYNRITNWEFGIYGGYEKKFIDESLTFKATIRMDKNVNFDAVFSPAASLVYQVAEEHIVRGGVSAAVRNPTMADQFLYYDVGRAILVGNLNGYDSLATLSSFNTARNVGSSFAWDLVEFIDVAPIKPERVRTFELGYRGTLSNRFYVDASYYYSVYDDFIGFNFGVDLPYTPDNPLPPASSRALRVAANAVEQITTQGASIGVNYYFAKKYALTTNYSWNKLLSGEDDPIIPAFNTPEHKVNIGINARDLKTDFGLFILKNWGFGVNYKWVEGFLFEGSPQFTGLVPTYYMVDAAVSANFKKINTTMKIGASNLTDNRVFTAYGGPFVGRMAYISLVYEWLNR
ncbi:MAG: TonB-dependent receptor domain-containing protein [Cryomorphaceae bacterium]|nr:TonB-dependent receptor [Flavobacteriales bacterium]